MEGQRSFPLNFIEASKLTLLFLLILMLVTPSNHFPNVHATRSNFFIRTLYQQSILKSFQKREQSDYRAREIIITSSN